MPTGPPSPRSPTGGGTRPAQAHQPRKDSQRNNAAVPFYYPGGALDPVTTRNAVAEFGKPVLLFAGEYDVGLPPRDAAGYGRSLRACRVGGAARRRALSLARRSRVVPRTLAAFSADRVERQRRGHRRPVGADRQAAITLSWPTSGAREDDELLGRSGHRDIAVDRSFDTRAERLWVDEDDQVELEPLRQLRGQRPDAGRRLECAKFDITSADDAGDPVGMCGEPG